MSEEKINHPKHYNAHLSGVEAIDVCEHMPFNIGNAVKYLFRAEHKGAASDDVKKAAWYLRREAARVRTWGHLESAYPIEWFEAKIDRVIAAEPMGSVLGKLLRIYRGTSGDVPFQDLEALASELEGGTK